MKKECVHHEPYNKLKGFAREKGLTYTDIADVLSTTQTTISKKINGQSDFYLSEQKLLKQKLGMYDELFTHKVAYSITKLK